MCRASVSPRREPQGSLRGVAALWSLVFAVFPSLCSGYRLTTASMAVED